MDTRPLLTRTHKQYNLFPTSTMSTGTSTGTGTGIQLDPAALGRDVSTVARDTAALAADIASKNAGQALVDGVRLAKDTNAALVDQCGPGAPKRLLQCLCPCLLRKAPTLAPLRPQPLLPLPAAATASAAVSASLQNAAQLLPAAGAAGATARPRSDTTA